MSFVDRLNTLRKVIGINNHFQREKNFSFRNCGILNYDFSVCGKKKSIADAHRNFVTHTGKNVPRSSFWERIANKTLLDFIEKAVLKFSFHIQEKALLKLSWLSLFEDVFIYDASPIRLPAGLSSIFPGNRKNHSPETTRQ